MSELFDEHSDQEPYYLDLNELETDVQQKLREAFESMTERAAIDVACFNPFESGKKPIDIHPHDEELLGEDPQLIKVFRENMLKGLHLDAPKNLGDARCVFIRPLTTGGLEVVYMMTRPDDGILIPVYAHYNRDRKHIALILYSYDVAQKKISYHEEMNDIKVRLVNGLGAEFSELEGLTLTELRQIAASFDEIQNLSDSNKNDS